MLGTTVVMKFHQGNIRHRDVFDGGALLGYFLGKQKVTRKIDLQMIDPLEYSHSN